MRLPWSRTPVTPMTDTEKLHWLANARPTDVFPSGFSTDNQLSLIALLARRIAALERGPQGGTHANAADKRP